LGRYIAGTDKNMQTGYIKMETGRANMETDNEKMETGRAKDASTGTKMESAGATPTLRPNYRPMKN